MGGTCGKYRMQVVLDGCRTEGPSLAWRGGAAHFNHGGSHCAGSERAPQAPKRREP